MLIVFSMLASLMFIVSVVLMACPTFHRTNRPGFGAVNTSFALAQLACVSAIALSLPMSIILGIAGSLALLVSAMLIVGWLYFRSYLQTS